MKTLRLQLMFLLCFCSSLLLGQHYRNAKAYINDFGKNELFVKESLMEYSKSIIDFTPDSRISATMERIYNKLEDINENLLRNDIGIDGDVALRDAFIQMNTKTIELLKNKSLKLNDYAQQSGLDYAAIFNNFAYKEHQIAIYYKDILAYETAKKAFGLKHRIHIRSFNKRNVFEYNAYLNLIFYKINVLDDKLMALLKYRSPNQVQECMTFMSGVLQESLLKTDLFKNDYEDQSLIEANVEFIHFIKIQNETLLPLFQQYVTVYEDFQKIKKNFLENNSPIKVEDYNAEVRRFNEIKNTFFDTLYSIQVKKSEMVNRWYVTNSQFLRNNIEFEDLYEKFTNND
ncbi:hypothetical protein [Flavobacterium sp.]|uniref:hypothetical protein n=1 Tax=Flavobacterium sp. TaxID=239 RepID=UPI00261FA2F6|nr:hypothetical protein [Flavobacterium sp.]